MKLLISIFFFCFISNDAGIIEFCGDKLKSFNTCFNKKLLDTDLNDNIEFEKIINIELWNRKKIPMRIEFDELIFNNNDYHELYFVLKHFGRHRNQNALLKNDSQELWLDFCTNKGWSVNMTSIMLPNNVEVHGFDSNWKIKGTILSNNDNIFPNVRDEIQLHQGDLNQTLPLILKKYSNSKIYGVSFNCGSYNDTIQVLNHISSKLIKGTIIYFHELINKEKNNDIKQDSKALYNWLRSLSNTMRLRLVPMQNIKSSNQAAFIITSTED